LGKALGGDAATATALAGWIALVLAELSAWGALLRATTHHHALAGVTFAIVGVVLASGAAVVLARFLAIARAATAPGRRALAAAALAVILASLVFLARLARTAGSPGALVDGLAIATAAGFASSPALASRRVLALLGPPVLVLVLALGISMLRRPGPLG